MFVLKIVKNAGKKYKARVGVKRRPSGYYVVNQFGFLACVLCFIDNAADPFKITVLVPFLRLHGRGKRAQSEARIRSWRFSIASLY